MAARTTKAAPGRPTFVAPAVTPAVKRGPGRPPRSREPVSAVPIPPDARRVDGVAVVNEEPVLSGLSGRGKQVPLKMSRLTLADGTVKHGCAECPFTADKRGDVMAHRMRDHPGTKAAAKTGKAGKAALDGPPMTMTLGELLDLARSAEQWGSMMDTLTERAEAAEKRADDAQAQLKKLKAALSRAGFRLDERDEQ